MNIALIAILLAAPSATGEKLAGSIVDSGHSTVAVVPAVVQKNGETHTTIGSLGPRGAVMADMVYDQLVDASKSGRYKGQLKVVSSRTMASAMRARGFTIPDLSDADKLKQIQQDVGADSLLFLATEDQPIEGGSPSAPTPTVPVEPEVIDKPIDKPIDQPIDQSILDRPLEIEIEAQLVDTLDGHTTKIFSHTDVLDLSRAAYQGQSFELRRWSDGALQNLSIDLPGAGPFGVGPRWEVDQYRALPQELAHPATIADFPYQAKVVVGRTVRQPHSIGPYQVVELNPGEEYAVHLHNNTGHGVYAAIYIDGVNSIDMRRVEPSELETKRHWFLAAGKVGAIGGWYTFARDPENRPARSPAIKRPFIIADAQESIAFATGFEDNIGMITVIYYTVGMEGIPQPDAGPRTRSVPSNIGGTTAGAAVDEMLEFSAGSSKRRGIMLGAETYYYRTKQQIDDLNSGDSSDPLLSRGQ